MMLNKIKKLKIVSIVGARPQFIKAAMVSRAIKRHNRINPDAKVIEVLIHTGQHYDHEMSQVFFDQMKIPAPNYHLGIGSGPHGRMTGEMLIAIEKVLMKERPDWVLVYGDTNTTLAGAFAAAKLPLPVAHVEAGLRSFNQVMPEEINRLLTDHMSCLLFCPTDTAVKNLENEGIVQGVHKVGDVMYDSYLVYKNSALRRSTILSKLTLMSGSFCLATVHRQENTDDSSRLLNIFKAFDELARKERPFIVPVHPRTRKVLKSQRIKIPRNKYVRLIQPLNYLDTLALESQAKMILTDSGGMQKEAFFFRVPCITLREETEWVETIDAGWNQLAGADTEKIIRAFKAAKVEDPSSNANFYGEGNASELIVASFLAASPFDLAAWKPQYAKAQLNQIQLWPNSRKKRRTNSH